MSVFDLVTVAQVFQRCSGVRIDLGDECGLLESEDPSIRESILRSAVSVYVAALDPYDAS